jgi:hypothetical protein
MRKNKLGISVVGLTTILFALGSTQQSSLLANEVALEATTSLPAFEAADSYSASDLKIFNEELAQDIQDLDTFCQRYPLNSRCFDREVIEQEEDELDFEAMDEPSGGSGFAITPNISTLGLGAGVTARINPNFNASLGISGSPFDTEFGFEAESDTGAGAQELDYDGELNLFNVSAIGSYYPSANSGFHLSGGLVFNSIELDGTGTVNQAGTVEIGDQTFNVAADDTVETEASFENDVSPYFAIGWGNPVRPGSRFSFFGNVGVMYTGSPEVSATATGTLANEPNIQDALDEETEEIEEDIDVLGGFYPILTLGVSYQF